MSRRKELREYTIKLVHPELGEFYYHYSNYSKIFFTQDLSKVLTWKTKKYAKNQISDIVELMRVKNNTWDSKTSIYLELGNNEPSIKNDKVVYSRKKYYYKIDSILSKTHIESAKNKIAELDKTLIDDSRMITKMIKKNKHLEKGFMNIINKLSNDINTYRKEHSFLNENGNSEDIYLDIVDASHNFRFLKLKTLNNIQEENEI